MESHNFHSERKILDQKDEEGCTLTEHYLNIDGKPTLIKGRLLDGPKYIQAGIEMSKDMEFSHTAYLEACAKTEIELIQNPIILR